jgi:hypothetical protein
MMKTFDQAIEQLKSAIKADYVRWTTQGGKKELTGYFKESVDKFDDSFTVKVGKKYTKIIRDNGVWGFIANEDFVSKGKVFNKGDILKAAGWQAPALNQARGNIFADDYSVAWTGPHYLK